MKRFLFSTTSGYGHIHPLLPLAHALQKAGHAVAFTTHPSRQALIEGAGFTFFPAAGDLHEDAEYLAVKAKQQTMYPETTIESELFAFNRIWCGISTRLRTPRLIEIATAWQADMIVRETAEFSALIAAEYLDLPHTAVSFAASLSGLSIFMRDAASQLNAVRLQYDLPPAADTVALYRYLLFVYAPPRFSLHAVDYPGEIDSLPDTTHFIRPEFFDNSRNDILPDWVQRLPAQPTVYVTMGTEVNNEPGMYPFVLQTIVDGLKNTHINLIVTIGHDKDPADFGPQPPNVHIERYIPQSLLLPYCDLLVIHGGSNTLLAAIDLGLPVVVIPLIADQFFNADVIRSLQLGQVISFDNLTPENILSIVGEMLANPLYRQNMQRLQTEMHALRGSQHAVDLLEEAIAHHNLFLR